MYSRKIVDKALALHTEGWTQQRIASTCGVSQRAVSHWINSRRRNLATELKRIGYCPRCSTAMIHEEAYAYLLGAYLGDGHITEFKRKPGLFVLWITYDSAYPQLVTYCHAAMGAVFPVKPFTVQRKGCTAIKAYSKHWACIFPQHGPGKKHERTIALEPWQQSIVDAHPEALVRGLIHSDGCRLINRVRKKLGSGDVTHYKYYEYPRYQFVNTSSGIVDILLRALDRLNIDWKLHVSKREPVYQDAYIVSISRKEAVARMDSFIGAKC
ncbi:helix-turn-helix domain-containing protein [Nocardiopsis sp. HNM0947]|uniref:Helix-turn-helix domain-containing protein n=1 Tax=Nocardiopsis coralli TaxID=2772213 RepID=A0ABR9P0E5_9ACTN|nr:helix-turn-helix domain-containing protein [Nocardiopsis coralli]MBE2997287.1 helix-turn-helix domain-containing protein [Nocardiopsis coralli]